jgi:hypothetical protein
MHVLKMPDDSLVDIHNVSFRSPVRAVLIFQRYRRYVGEFFRPSLLEKFQRNIL